MLRALIRFSIFNRGVVFLATGLLIMAGWASFKTLPIDAVPDVTNNQVQINTGVEGLTPEEIERYVTVPVEYAMGGLTGLLTTRSISRFGLSQVTLIFEDKMDIYLARQMVAERLQEAASLLPPGLHPRMGPVTTGLGEIYFYTLRAKTPVPSPAGRTRQLMELRAIQEWEVKPKLLSVSGVAEVNTTGGYEKQFHIQPDPKKMARFGLHFDDIIKAMERTNKNVGGGYIQQTAEQFLVQATGLLKSVEDIRHVPIKSLSSLRTIMVKDVAQVQLATELRTGAALVNGQEEVLGTAMMRFGENSRVVARRVAEKIAEIQKTLPNDLEILTLYDRSTLVDATLRTVRHNLVVGASLVVVVLILLLGNLRAALITAVIIPITLLGTFILMKLFGLSGNLMSLGALDFGIIIDGVVIVIDNCVRRVHNRIKDLGRPLTSRERQQAVQEATLEIRQSAGFGEIIIIVVFLPIYFFTGVEGKMFIPMVGTFSIAVGVAVFLSFTLAPALASWFLVGKVTDREPFLMRGVKKFYQSILTVALRLRGVVLSGAALAVVASVFLFFRLGGEFLPQLDEGSLVIQFVRPADTSLDRIIDLQSRSEKLIASHPAVSHVFNRLGTAEIATDPMPISVADTFIMLKEKEEWVGWNGERINKSAIGDEITAKLASHVPGQRMLLTQPIQMRFNELLEGIRADVAVKIFGDDMDEIVALGKKMKEVIEEVPGAGDVELEIQDKSPLLHVAPRMDYLRGLGLSVQEVLDAVGTALGGTEVGVLYDGVKRFPIVVRLAEEDRSDLEALKRLPVGFSENATMPLSEVADIGFEETHSTILREKNQRRAALMINPRGRDTQSVVEEAQAAVAKNIDLPTGYWLEWGGNFKNLARAKNKLMLLAPVVIILVLFIIYAAFGNMPQTLLVFSGVPLALVGGVSSLILRGLPFSISAGVGFVALSGIAVLNGVVLLNCLNDLKMKGLSGERLIRQGTDLRLRPVLMTALVEMFGFLPMMLSTGVGAEVQRPLATVVIGGVASSTLLTLVVLPVLVSYLETKLWRKV